VKIRRAGTLIVCAGVALMNLAAAADDAAVTPTTEVRQLRELLVKQQQQIDALKSALEEQKAMLERLAGSAGAAPSPAAAGTSINAGVAQHTTPVDRLVASTTPVALPPPSSPTPLPASRSASALPPPQAAVAAPASAPLQLQLGNITIMPVGFMDLTISWKDKNAGGALGTNFGSIPYNNAFPAAKLSEFRFSPQNSRIGFRIDGDWKGTHFMAYNENDFLGNTANNAQVTNGAFVPRLRLFWVDLKKDKYEFLVGQSWSMLTPNRKGISALPGDLFYSQVIDVNYVVGLPWTRQPGMRFIYHPTDKVAIGFSAENPDQYIGGSGGGPTVTLPAAPSPLNGLGGTQLDNASNVQTIPNLHPDFIAKLAFDPNSHVHVEIPGILRTFKVWNQTTNQYSTKVGGGGGINGNFEVAKGFRVVTNNIWGDGIGRYFFGDSPDLMVRASGEVSPIHSGGWVEGVEATVKNTLLYSYYSGVYIGRNTAYDVNGTSLIGYGYRGAPNSQNKTIQEFTIGFNQTFWKDPKYGALNLMGQYAWIFRNPWYIAPNSPKSTHLNSIFINVRYTLPGAAPPAK
jgi:hypothetical protein